MHDQKFSDFAEALMAATLRSVVEEFADTDPEIKREADLYLEQRATADLATLFQWAVERGLENAKHLFGNLVLIATSDTLEWDQAKRLVDDIGYENFDRPRRLLLEWMHDTPDGRFLQQQPLVIDGSDDRPPRVETNALVGGRLNEYAWFWSRYLTALVDLGDFEGVIDIPDQGVLLMLTLVDDSPELSSLSYAVGSLYGALVERRRKAELSAGEALILRMLNDGFEDNRRRHRFTQEVQYSIVDEVSSLRRVLDDMSSFFLEALVDLGNRIADLDAEALNTARADLVQHWAETHTVRQQEEIESEATRLLGGAAGWRRLSDLTKEDMRIYVSIARRGGDNRVQVLFLTLAVEREFGLALERVGLGGSGGFEAKIHRALDGQHEQLKKYALELDKARVPKARNEVHHGNDSDRRVLDRLAAALLVRQEGQHGLLGLIVMVS